MEHDIRGLIEKDLDTKLSDMALPKLVTYWLTMGREWQIESTKSALIGHLFGSVCDYHTNLLVQIGRSPTNNDIKELSEIFSRRMLEIKSKINLIVNK